MPTEAFHRWADGFDHRFRFGIPTLPALRRAIMSPSIVPLPARAGSLKFSDEDVEAVIALLPQLKDSNGQAVRLTDAPDDKENTARRRAEIMKEQIESRPDAIPTGYKLRGHVLTAGEHTVKRISGKNYKVFPENFAAISVVRDDDTATPTTPPAPETPPPGDTDAPEAPGGKKVKP